MAHRCADCLIVHVYRAKECDRCMLRCDSEFIIINFISQYTSTAGQLAEHLHKTSLSHHHLTNFLLRFKSRSSNWWLSYTVLLLWGVFVIL